MGTGRPPGRPRALNPKRPYRPGRYVYPGRRLSSFDRDYEPIDASLVPAGITWKIGSARRLHEMVYVSANSREFLMIRNRTTGACAYGRRRDLPQISPAETIDAEPPRPRLHLRVGSQCWFVTDGHWFLVEVVARGANYDRMTIKSVTGKDAERAADWPYGELVDFPVSKNRGKSSGLGFYDRLRPLSARRP